MDPKRSAEPKGRQLPTPDQPPDLFFTKTKVPGCFADRVEFVGLGCAYVHGRSAVERASESGALGVGQSSSRAAWRANRRAKASSEADALGSSRAARSRSAALECFGPIVLSTPQVAAIESCVRF
jgi:hypothetical protein